MWRAYLLWVYALLVGTVLLVLGLIGFSLVPSNALTFPENALHLAVGLIFCSGGLLLGNDPGSLGGFVGGMGFLLLLGKGTIVATRWVDAKDFHLGLFGGICLVAGATSLLVAALTRGSSDEPS